MNYEAIILSDWTSFYYRGSPLLRLSREDEEVDENGPGNTRFTSEGFRPCGDVYRFSAGLPVQVIKYFDFKDYFVYLTPFKLAPLTPYQVWGRFCALPIVEDPASWRAGGKKQ